MSGKMGKGMEERKEQWGSSGSVEETLTVFQGREDDSLIHSIAALTIWLGAIHFVVALVLTALLFLPLSLALTFVLLPFPSSLFLSLFPQLDFQIKIRLTNVYLFQGFWVAFSLYGDSN